VLTHTKEPQMYNFLFALHKYREKCMSTVYYRHINFTINWNWMDVDFYQIEWTEQNLCWTEFLSQLKQEASNGNWLLAVIHESIILHW